VALADGQRESTRRAAAVHGLKALTLDQLLVSDASLILCLTPPQSHHEIGLRVVAAGKHFYTEKPLAATFEQACELMSAAGRQGVRVGCAPDTILGAAAQTARALIDQGVIGTVRHGCAHAMNHGPDHWHPDPAPFYRQGAGPLMDIGIYPMAHLVHHLGPVDRVCARATATTRERVVPSGPQAGQTLTVEVATHVVAALSFVAGPVVDLTASFDVWKHGLPPMELYGEGGTLQLADPNRFEGFTRYSHCNGAWIEAGPTTRRAVADNQRGLGVIDMLRAIERDEGHRCNGHFSLHVLEVLEAVLHSATDGSEVGVHTRCERPPLLASLFH
jgi:predicted dehydrogenase